MKWQHPVGLLFDLFSGNEPVHFDADADKPASKSKPIDSALPWKLTLHFSDWPAEHLIALDAHAKVQHDAYINSVKEADFLRNGTGKVIMSLSKDDSTTLWQSVVEHDLARFDRINHKFVNPPPDSPIRHVPIKVYLPTTIPSRRATPSAGTETETSSTVQPRASLKVVQTLVPPMTPGKTQQTFGTALHSMLPTVFPSRRSYIHAHAVLHGVVVPLTAPVLDLMRAATYADGFLHVAVVMVS